MPARLYPKDGPRSKVSHGECAVYRALAAGGLPDGWTAWHSLRLRVGNSWEGEGDFVFANPKRGLLVLEVKGGRIELVGGRWLQNGHEMDQPPRTQAMEFAKHLGMAMRGRGMLVPGYGAACAFPDVDFDNGPGASDVADLVIGHRDLSYLADILPGLLDRAVPADYLLPPGDWIGCLTGLWGETWVPSINRTENSRNELKLLWRRRVLPRSVGPKKLNGDGTLARNYRISWQRAVPCVPHSSV